MIRQKKIDESIDAWKNALRLNSADSSARDNLVKALLEKKKQEQQEQQNKKNQPDKKKDDNRNRTRINLRINPNPSRAN